MSSSLLHHLPEQFIQRLQLPEACGQIITDSMAEEPSINLTVANQIDALAAVPALQVIRQGRVQGALVAVSLQRKGILLGKPGNGCAEAVRLCLNQAAQVVHGLSGGAVEAHAVAAAVGGDLKEEAGGGLPVGAVALEGDPEAGLVG